ncbi:MAG: alanine--tRNA ligase [Candidatus Brocadiia bacterium]
MKTDEIRETFLAFFEQRGHRRLASDSLVPSDDPTLLFTGAGMNQFKDEFQGKGRVQEGLRRACTSQKCFRADDLDKVGHTAAHHTFFEMLGNFSFGDYFKREAIAWAWELIVEAYGFQPDRLVVSIYEHDEEARRVWREVVGLPEPRIYAFGEHENYWPADAPSSAPPGTLCGPCSEIFMDYGPQAGCQRPQCDPSCSCDRYVEVWNLVFQQFTKGPEGRLEPLPTKNIDTGAGLERLAAMLQGVGSDYEIDIFAPIVGQISQLTGQRPEPGTPHKVRVHRIADHIRGAVFCIGDGVLPGNKGRGYVLRRILRRALCDGHDLGVDGPFLYRIVPTVVEVMGRPYPELVARRENVARIIQAEEESFVATLTRGSAILAERLDQAQARGRDELPAEAAAELWDTYGFPFEMTEQICRERGLGVDRGAFEAAMAERQAGSGGEQFGQVFDTSALAQVKSLAPPTDFRGYETTASEARVLALVVDEQLAEEAPQGAEVAVVLDRTPFYGEAGGQVGDAGTLESDQARVEIDDTRRADSHIRHHGRVVRGTLHKGDIVRAVVDPERRQAVRRNHTATHLLHWALRQVLGEHAEQAGSLVGPDRLRFDFTHFAPLGPREVERVEELVNQRILENTPVEARHTTYQEAQDQGAIALFGEKYGEKVRMVNVGGFSKELCGGTHVERTGDIGLFLVLSETGIASGVRRIEALTGQAAYRHVADQDVLIARLAELLKTPRHRLLERAEELLEENKRLGRELEKAKRQSFAAASGGGPFQEKARVGDTRLFSGTLEDASPGDLRIACDQLRQKHASAAVIVGTASEDSANLVCGLTRDLVDRGLDAGEIAKAAAKKIGGGGGGRADMAQAGGKKPQGLQEALDFAIQAIQARLEEG